MKDNQEIPAFIDYDSSDDTEPTRWNSVNFEKFWRSSLVKKRKASAPLWTIKDKTLLKRMLEEYEEEEIQGMIEWWTEHATLNEATVFPIFYTKRAQIYERYKASTDRKDYGWDFD